MGMKRRNRVLGIMFLFAIFWNLIPVVPEVDKVLDGGKAEAALRSAMVLDSSGVDRSYLFPSLEGAIAVTAYWYDGRTGFLNGSFRGYVLYKNGTIKSKVTSWSLYNLMSGVDMRRVDGVSEYDVTNSWPSTVNAVSIATDGIRYYVAYSNGAIKFKMPNSGQSISDNNSSMFYGSGAIGLDATGYFFFWSGQDANSSGNVTGRISNGLYNTFDATNGFPPKQGRSSIIPLGSSGGWRANNLEEPAYQGYKWDVFRNNAGSGTDEEGNTYHDPPIKGAYLYSVWDFGGYPMDGTRDDGDALWFTRVDPTPCTTCTVIPPTMTDIVSGWIPNTPTITWAFNNPDPQVAYQVQRSSNALFASIDYDSGIVDSGATSHIVSTSTTGKQWYRVRVKSNAGAWSSWSMLYLDYAPGYTAPGIPSGSARWKVYGVIYHIIDSRQEYVNSGGQTVCNPNNGNDCWITEDQWGWTTINTWGFDNSGVFEGYITGAAGTYPDNGAGDEPFGFKTPASKWFVKVSSAPIMTLLNDASVYYSNESSFIPAVSVADADGDSLIVSYYIDNESAPRESRTITNTASAQNVSFNALNIGALAEGSHTFRFTVNDGQFTTEQSIDIYVDKTPPDLSGVQFTSTGTTITITGSASDALAGLPSAPYRYTVGGVMTEWTSQASYTQPGLTPNTEYSVKFEARDNVGLVASNEQRLFSKAQAPSLSVVGAAESALDLTISDANPASTRFMIQSGANYVTATGALTTAPTWITLSSKKITITGLTANTAYSFQAKAMNGNDIETAYSPTVAGTTLAVPPVNVTVTPSQRSITIAWQGISGVSSYEIEVDGQIINNSTSTTYTHSGLIPETPHTYRVRAMNAGGAGNWSPLIQKNTLPDPPPTPSNVQATPLQTTITVVWDSAARATAYELELDGTVRDVGLTTSYTHTELTPETTHSYRVRAKNIGGISDWSAPITLATLPYPPEVPTSLTADVTNRSVVIHWTAPARAVDYEVEADGLILDNGSSTSYQHESLEPLSGHTYRVRAKNAGGKGVWSTPLDVTTHPDKPVTPANIMTTSDETSITLMWYEVPHTDSYEVEIDGGTVITLTDKQFVQVGLSPNQRHTYRIRAKNITGYSEWSNPVTMGTLPVAENGTTLSLTNMAAIVTNRTITFSWDTVAPNARYDIEVDGVLLDNGHNTIYNHTGLRANEFHTYKIRIHNEDNNGEWVAILALSTLPDLPDAPTHIEAFAMNNSIELRWERTNDATGYEIEVDGVTYDTGTNSAYVHGGLTTGTGHTYRVRAKNITGVTAWSPAITKSTTSPTYQVNGVKNQNFDLSLYGFNVQDFSEFSFVITYNPSEIEVVDLYNFTPKLDVLSSGTIPGSNLEVTYTPGMIRYKMNQNVVPGTSWSGEVATVTFRSRIDGLASIDVTAN